MKPESSSNTDLAMYEAIASAAIRRHGNDEHKTRRALADFDSRRLFASGDLRSGLDLVAEKLAAHIREKWPAPPPDPTQGRYP